MDDNTDTGELRALLIAARNQIGSPRHWTQGAYARDASGDSCGATHPHARRWCALGALEHCAISLHGAQTETDSCWTVPLLRSASEALDLAAQAVELDTEHRYAMAVNDQLTHDDVLAMYARAIAALDPQT